MKLSDVIKEGRISLGMTMDELAIKSGLSKGYISMLEKGENPKTKKAIIPSLETFRRLSHALGLDINELIGIVDADQKILLAEEGDAPFEKNPTKRSPRPKCLIPVPGRVQAGVPVEAMENIIDYEEISEEMAQCGEFFGLQVRGSSMEPRFLEGDVVIVKRQPDVETGEIGIVLLNGADATVKRVVKHDNGISLIALNSAYPPMFYTIEEVEKLPVEILGKVVELRGKF